MHFRSPLVGAAIPFDQFTRKFYFRCQLFLGMITILSASILLILVEAATEDFAGRQTFGRFLPIFHRESSKWPVFIFIIVACSTLYIFEPQENLTQLTSIDMVAGQLEASLEEYRESVDEYQSQLLGHSHGLIVAFNNGTLYFAQNYIPRIDQSWAQWSLWIYFAIKSAASTGLVIYLLLGICTVMTEKQRIGWVLLGKSLFEKSFTLTLILLFVVSIALGNISILLPIAFPANAVSCSETIDAFQQASLTRTRELDEDESRLRNEISGLIDEQLNFAFSNAEDGVTAYLNWDFSVLGRYEQAWVQYVLRRPDPTPEVLSDMVTGPINAQLGQIQQLTNSSILSGLNRSAEYIQSQVNNGSQNSDCFVLPSLDFDQESIGLGQPQLAITTTALAAKVIAKKAAAKAGAKGAAKVAAKGFSKIAGAGTGGFTSGSICGPAVLVCGPALAVVGWVGVDAAIIEAEEYVEREPIESMMLNELERQKGELRSHLIAFNNGIISTGYNRINSTFSILEDGINQ